VKKALDISQAICYNIGKISIRQVKEMFPEKMKRIRKEGGWTSKELAEILKIDSSTIWNYENGKRKPHYDVLTALVRKAGVNPAELF